LNEHPHSNQVPYGFSNSGSFAMPGRGSVVPKTFPALLLQTIIKQLVDLGPRFSYGLLTAALVVEMVAMENGVPRKVGANIDSEIEALIFDRDAVAPIGLH
jgi:hypothetical protein